MLAVVVVLLLLMLQVQVEQVAAVADLLLLLQKAEQARLILVVEVVDKDKQVWEILDQVVQGLLSLHFFLLMLLLHLQQAHRQLQQAEVIVYTLLQLTEASRSKNSIK
jgi:hypothetical protein